MNFGDAMPRGFESFKRSSSGKLVMRSRRGVSRSAELIRVAGLPRRSVEVYDDEFALALSIEMRRDGSAFAFKPKQAAMLVEAVEAGGAFCMLGVGYGKTTIAPLFGKVMGAAVAVLLVPPSLKAEVEQKVIPRLMKEIDFMPPKVVTYAELSTAKGGDILDRVKPDLIIADEVHLLKNKAAARTKRFVRYFDENPGTKLVALSGTITRRSIMDFFHIVQLTHKGRLTPMTRSWPEAKEWALALDPQVPEDQRFMPGALESMCATGEDARQGFNRRLLETEGVVGGSAEDVGASLIFRRISPEIPPAVADALKRYRKYWETPSGEFVSDAKDFTRKARELAQGFYYEWIWPDGQRDEQWLAARAAWRKIVSEVCKLNRQGLDSELLVRNAAEREVKGALTRTVPEGERLPKSIRAEAVQAWREWDLVRGRQEPETRAVWIDDFIVRKMIEWVDVDEEGPGIVWYDSRAIAERAVELGFGKRVCSAGNAGNEKLLALANQDAPGGVFCSQQAHGTGKNLQRWCRNLVVPWGGGATWEQTIGRTHRPNQDADEVIVDVFAHTEELRKSIEGALEQAKYIEEVTGVRQKMLMGRWL